MFIQVPSMSIAYIFHIPRIEVLVFFGRLMKSFASTFCLPYCIYYHTPFVFDSVIPILWMTPSKWYFLMISSCADFICDRLKSWTENVNEAMRVSARSSFWKTNLAWSTTSRNVGGSHHLNDEKLLMGYALFTRPSVAVKWQPCTYVYIYIYIYK